MLRSGVCLSSSLPGSPSSHPYKGKKPQDLTEPFSPCDRLLCGEVPFLADFHCSFLLRVGSQCPWVTVTVQSLTAGQQLAPLSPEWPLSLQLCLSWGCVFRSFLLTPLHAHFRCAFISLPWPLGRAPVRVLAPAREHGQKLRAAVACSNRD